MQLNEARFLQNGKCGYVLQPDCLRDPAHNPFDKSVLSGVEPVTITLTVSSFTRFTVSLNPLTPEALNFFMKALEAKGFFSI